MNYLTANIDAKQFSGAIGYSLGVELSGMLHLYVAMLALGLPASIGASASGYIIAVLMMVISPFLRGLGAVELSYGICAGAVWIYIDTGIIHNNSLSCI
jgi:phosphatidylglycerol lysyltransferase